MQLNAKRQASRTRVDRALRLFLFVLCGCFVFEWAFALVNTYLLHLHYPFTSPLSRPDYHYSDWLNYLPRAAHLGQPHFLIQEGPGWWGLPFAYPIPCIYVYFVFLHLFANPTLAFLLFAELAFVCATAFFSLYLRRRGAGVLPQLCCWAALLLGMPAVFTLERANFEIFLWVLVAGGIVAFIKDWKYAAAIFFAVAACMKIYPAIFFLLFLRRRQYAPILAGIVVFALTLAVSLRGAGPDVHATLADVSAVSKKLHDEQIVRAYEDNLRWDHSLFGEEKQAIYTFDRATHRIAKDANPAFPGSLRIYTLLAPLAFAALYLSRLRRLPLLNQFAALTLCSVLLPFVSYEYTLIHFLLVWAVFLVFLLDDVVPGRVTLPNRSLGQIALLCAVVIAPITALSFEHFSGQVKGIALLLLLSLFASVPMPSTLFGELERPLPG